MVPGEGLGNRGALSFHIPWPLAETHLDGFRASVPALPSENNGSFQQPVL